MAAVGWFGFGGEGDGGVDDFAVEGFEGFFALEGAAELAFPDADDSPAEGLEFGGLAEVTGSVGRDFGQPEVGVGFRHGRIAATGVAVPEAAVDEDDGAVLGEDDVGSAGELALQAEAQAAGEQELAHQDFGLGVPALDGSHASAALFGGHRVGHVLITIFGSENCPN